MTTRIAESYRVQVPEGASGNVSVERFEVRADSFENMRLALTGRACAPGIYTALYRNGELWMSDTSAEWNDHRSAVFQIMRRGGRVLINGLGLGMVVQAALRDADVEHVDVVELDSDVIALVGPTYEGSRCTIHQADAYAIPWPTGTRWSVAWHDIWLDLCVDNLAEMSRLHRKYGRRVDWQGSWGRELLERERRREARWSW